MFDMVKAAFELANNGWLGAVLLILLLSTVTINVIIFRRQIRLLAKSRAILDKTEEFGKLTTDFNGFSTQIDECFNEMHQWIDDSDTKMDSNHRERHEQLTRHHERVALVSGDLGKDLAELKGMLSSAMTGSRVGIK